jgi:hypothetical protein
LTFGEGSIDGDTVMLSPESESESDNDDDGDDDICGIPSNLITEAAALPHYGS